MDIRLQQSLIWKKEGDVYGLELWNRQHYGIENNRFKSYVANRINEINEATDVNQWRHCPGKLNPADDCSRVLDPQQFLANERWLREEHWPQNNVEDVPVDKHELKKEKTITMTDFEGRTQRRLHELLERYLSWTKLLKSIAWIGKFIELLKKGKRADHLRVTTGDIKKASVVVVALVLNMIKLDFLTLITVIEKDHLGDWSPEKDCC